MRRFKAEWVEAPQVTKTENNLFSSKTIKLPQVNMRLFLNAIEDCYESDSKLSRVISCSCDTACEELD